jgi:para-aminobenzoate synthetase component I
MLNFGKKFGIFCLLDNHSFDFDTSYECIAAAGVTASFNAAGLNGLQQLDFFDSEYHDWKFGHISYGVTSETEEGGIDCDRIGFPGIHFFVPEIVFILTENEVQIGVCPGNDADQIYRDITAVILEEKTRGSVVSLKSRFNRGEYIVAVEKLQQHIKRGDCYEINFCQEFFAENAAIDPYTVYLTLSELSPSPFSAFYHYNNSYLLCASPERFLKRTGATIISQPMKGTAPRIPGNPQADAMQKENLLANAKERSENIMTVDLVRNDLSKICAEGSVHVKALLSIYTFAQVYQMVSTIEGKIDGEPPLSEIFQATFPMGSMTGAPKKRVMELINKYERTKRGLFSGTLGYIRPDGDFDFNVVIRSLFYNQAAHYLSVQAGSAITFKSDPGNEYDECLLKIAAIRKALE